MLSMEQVLFRQSSSRAKVTDPSRDLGCDPWSIHQPRPPNQTGALASAGGNIYERVTYCATSQFLTLGVNGHAMKFWFFAIRVYYEKWGHLLKPFVPKFRPDLSARLKDIAEKQVPQSWNHLCRRGIVWPYFQCPLSYVCGMIKPTWEP